MLYRLSTLRLESMGSTGLDDKRICSRCHSGKTYIRPKTGWPQWGRDRKGGWLCSKCYNKTVTNPKWQKINNPIYNPRRIGFKRKRYAAKENPRKEVCKRCGTTGARTEMHHKEYDESNPFAHTIELCMKCHFLTKEIYRNGGWFTSQSDENGKSYRSS